MRCPLFARIAPNDVFALTEYLSTTERRYERGEALWLTGDAVSACAVVLSGGVRAESLLPSGEAQPPKAGVIGRANPSAKGFK